MKITNDAKKMLEEIFASNEGKCLKGSLQQSCCGTSLIFNLAKLEDGDDPDSINGISVLMEDSVKERAENITIAVKNGELTIQDATPSGC